MKRFVLLFLLGVLLLPAYSQTATIYIMREANIHSSVELPTIAINNTFIGKLPSRRYYKCTVPAGKVHIECDVAESQHVRFEIKSGEIAYFNTFTAMGRFERLANADGEYRLKKLTLERALPIANVAEDEVDKQAVAEAETKIVMPQDEFEDELLFASIHEGITRQNLVTIYNNRDKYFLPESDLAELKVMRDMLGENRKNLDKLSKYGKGTNTDVKDLSAANIFLHKIDSMLDNKYHNILLAEAQPKEPVIPTQPVVAPIQQTVAAAPVKEEKPKSDVDINIPVTDVKRENTWVLIIANENYRTDISNVSSVPFAINDGEVFREYCIKTLGIPEGNISFCSDATSGIMRSGIIRFKNGLNLPMEGGTKGIVYYCGHGDHNVASGEAYMIPTDGHPSMPESCISLSYMYRELSQTNALSVTYFIDACFSGTGKDGSMLLAARGIAQAPKNDIIEGNTVVFSASTGDETAIPYTEKQHGMFTYFLLKKLQESQGNITYGELADYIKSKVTIESYRANKSQTPTVATAMGVVDTWEQLTF